MVAPVTMMRTVLIFGLSIQVATCASTYYVATNGSSLNNGSIGSPWDLGTALTNNSLTIQPGDTVYLRDGEYLGWWVSSLTGAVVRPYPGEHAQIEATNEQSFVFGTPLRINGSDTDYIGLDIWNSATNRFIERYTTVGVYGPRTRIINCTVHDGGSSIGLWEQATNSTVYGCILYNFGYQIPPTDQGHAHAIYTHSSSPNGHHIENNIMCNGFGFGLHCFAAITSMPLAGFRISGNASFNNGALNTNSGGLWMPNYLLGGNVPVSDSVMIGNYGYYSAGFTFNLQAGFTSVSNTGAIIASNYFAGGCAQIEHWTNFTFYSNSFEGLSSTVRYLPLSGAAVNWDSNHYSASFPTLFSYNNTTMTFAQWKTASGFDANSVVSTSNPFSPLVVVEPNAFESGRANVIVYNWGNTATVPVNLSTVLSNGDGYEVRNAQNFYALPVLVGNYAGGSVAFPMTGLPAAKPVGLNAPPPTSKFNVFVVRKTAMPAPNALRVMQSQTLRAGNLIQR